jgi:HSP20 family molecular chaperone IbpA
LNNSIEIEVTYVNDLKKILSQAILIQKQLFNSSERDQTKKFTLRQLAEVAETLMDSSPNMEIHSYKDEVIVSGVIPNILNSQDISVKLDNSIILRIECIWHKSDETGNLESKPCEFKKKIELPYPVIPETLSATYQKGILSISAKKTDGTNTWAAEAQFLD